MKWTYRWREAERKEMVCIDKIAAERRMYAGTVNAKGCRTY